MLKITNLQNDIFGPVSFEIGAGCSLVVRGASGSGKTRFLRAVADLDLATGEVFLDNVERSEMTAFEWRRKVRYLAAEPPWWFETVAEHFKDAGSLGPKMQDLDLPEKLLGLRVRECSTGERQRLAFLRAIADEPDVLLLDEPTSALDERSIELVEAMIDGELKRGAVLLMASHSGSQVKKYGVQFLTFESGRAVHSRQSLELSSNEGEL